MKRPNRPIAGTKTPARRRRLRRNDHNLLGDPRSPDTIDSAIAANRRKRVNDGSETRFVAVRTRLGDRVTGDAWTFLPLEKGKGVRAKKK
jgi:hypothetical protein